MHEHIGEQLPDSEATSGNGVERTHGGDVGIATLLQDHSGQENNEVDDEQIFHYRW